MSGPEDRMAASSPGWGRATCQPTLLRLQLPPIEPDVRFSLIRLTDTVHPAACADQYRTVPVRR